MFDTVAPDAKNNPAEGVSTHRGGLTKLQLMILTAFGLSFWLAAALFIRVAPWGVFDRGIGTATLFTATVPLAWTSVWLAKHLATLAPEQLLPGAAIASAAAMLCDGVGLIWWPIYGAGDRLPGAALLLWGVGLILFAAFFEGRRQSRRMT